MATQGKAEKAKNGFGIVNAGSLAMGILTATMGFWAGYGLATKLIVGLLGVEWLETFLSFGGGVYLGVTLGMLMSVSGFQALPEVSQSIISVAGWRWSWLVFSEGPAWRPPFISKFLTESAQQITYDFPALKCLTKDDIEVQVDGSVRAFLFSINQSLGIEGFREALRQEYESSVRSAIRQRGALDLQGLKSFIADRVQNGGEVTPEGTPDDKKVKLTGLESAIESMGRKIVTVKITEIQLPQSFLNALEEKQTEGVQANAEGKDTDTLIENYKKARAAMEGVSGDNILQALQAKRGYATVLHVSGGSPVERAAAILGNSQQGGSGSKQPPAGDNDPQGGPNKSNRRRNNK